MTAVADTPGYQGDRTWTSFIGAVAGRLHAVPAQSVAGAGARISSRAVPAPHINIEAARQKPVRARSSQEPRCQPRRQVQAPQSRRSSAIVGELNNAYNDGTVGTFTYGREHVAESDVGIVHTFTDITGKPEIDISDQNTIKNGGVAKFPPATKRYARKLKTEFEFTREAARNDTCAVWDIYIRATSWIGGTDSRTKQPGALDRCDPKAFSIGYEGTGGFLRYQNDAVRWTRGAEAFGFYTTTKSGFSTNVETAYTWGGPANKRHYLCGPDGKQSPYDSGRIFSGARK